MASSLAPNGPNFSVFLPLIMRNYGQPLLMGVYPQGWLSDEATFTGELAPLDTWTGKQHSLVGTFLDIQQSVFVVSTLSATWDHGYTPFVNLMAPGTTAAADRRWESGQRTECLGACLQDLCRGGLRGAPLSSRRCRR